MPVTERELPLLQDYPHGAYGGRVKSRRPHKRVRLTCLAIVTAAGRAPAVPSAHPGGQDRPTLQTSGRLEASANVRSMPEVRHSGSPESCGRRPSASIGLPRR